jgi:cobyrinic acid a,c-diamide synthase
MQQAPRLVIAGLGGDSGKTLVSLGLLLAFQEAGLAVRAFKKGPDYIDAAWLSWASASPARNLDTFMMGVERCGASFSTHAVTGGINIIEGNRGIFDGSDALGTHSTAELAKALDAPIILVVNATKVTRTAAALVLGCQRMDPAARIEGVILNQVSGGRHEKVIREAIEATCGVPILGVLKRAGGSALLPGRHLGLVTPAEHPRTDELRSNLLGLVTGALDMAALRHIAEAAPAIDFAHETPVPVNGAGLRIGVVRDSAFTFYYPENLEALEASGAEVVPVSALSHSRLPAALDALYIGGGFPETHGGLLANNANFLHSLKAAADSGLPIYAECGGLMLLSRAIRWKGEVQPMAGVLPFDVEVSDSPQGHGYIRMTVDDANPFFPVGTTLLGHEFHYSRILSDENAPATACQVHRGTGSFKGRDGVVKGGVWASYAHLHALATPMWAHGLVAAARGYARSRPSPPPKNESF